MASISRWINSWKFASTLKISIFLATTRHHSKKFLQNSNLIEASGPEGIIERKNLLNFDTSKKMNQHGNMWGIHYCCKKRSKEKRISEFVCRLRSEKNIFQKRVHSLHHRLLSIVGNDKKCGDFWKIREQIL